MTLLTKRKATVETRIDEMDIVELRDYAKKQKKAIETQRQFMMETMYVVRRLREICGRNYDCLPNELKNYIEKHGI